jgi:predicted O-methyltransferase YrrM
MPEDLPFERPFQFEQLAGLFSSTSLDHAVISMTVRQAAYIFGLIRSMQVKRIIEVGRYKGGCTLLMAMAMNGEGQLWSIDLGEKEARLARDKPRSYDAMLADRCARLGLENVCLLVGDSRTINFETGAVDLVVIDGDHRYETVKSDFNRFATRLRKGGALLLDDVYPDGFFTRGNTDSKRFTEEVERGGDFRFVKAVNRMAHFERLGSNLVPS